MDKLKQFDIPFVGLKNDIHKIKYDIDARFFNLYEESPIKDAKLEVELELDKKSSFFILNFKVDGTVNVPCDRCLELFDYELLTDFTIIVKFEEREDKVGTEEDVLYLTRSESHLNVADIIYDYILINIPIQIFHSNDENGVSQCNPKVLEKLKLKKETEEIDPRWANLSKIKN